MKNKLSYASIIYDLLREGTADYKAKASSSISIPGISVSIQDIAGEDRTSANAREVLFTQNVGRSGFSQTECLLTNRNVIAEEIERDIVVSRLVTELENALELFDNEGEDFSVAERKIIEIEHAHNMRIVGEVIQNVYVKHFDKPLYLIGICKALLRYDLDEVRPWGPIILPGLLNHSDDRVKEYTVELIDNWNDVELLPILKTLQVSSKWLKDYIRDVIGSLEKENVLHQKAI